MKEDPQGVVPYSLNITGSYAEVEKAFRDVQTQAFADLVESKCPGLGKYASAQLCYVNPDRGNEYTSKFTVAYFTTQDLKQQHGDDWGKSKYEDNAGTPYDYDARLSKDVYHVVRVKFFLNPSTEEGTNQGSYSVRDLNQRKSYWLELNDPEFGVQYVLAGTTLAEFIVLLEKLGKSYEVWVDYDPTKPEWEGWENYS